MMFPSIRQISMQHPAHAHAQGATVLQMVPFGWSPPGLRASRHREATFANMAVTANCSYHRWGNQRWDHAYLRK